MLLEKFCQAWIGEEIPLNSRQLNTMDFGAKYSQSCRTGQSGLKSRKASVECRDSTSRIQKQFNIAYSLFVTMESMGMRAYYGFGA
uniref:Uncharacterized protein n=1 Tax=Romanomermis culicivorax TaxID=13658 RepID=A0A915IM39_ROMCU